MKRIVMFKHIEHPGIKLTIFKHMKPMAFAPGASMIVEGSVLREIYFIVSGVALLQRQSGSDSPVFGQPSASIPIIVAQAKSGNVVGAECLLSGSPSRISAVTETLTEVYTISNEAIAGIISEHPFVAIRD